MSEALKQNLRDDHPSRRQARAADPAKSVWVGASAGTGKTKVLIDRVLRLMLQGKTPPGRILCLTFTRTAAAEMSNRIYAVLSGWSVKPDAQLRDDLARLTDEEPPQEMMDAARRLFAQVLDVPGGLKIMTIHAFCQSVLKRFPLEAGLPPHFQMMDEAGATEYLDACRHKIVRTAQATPDSELSRAFNLLTLYLDADGMSGLMREITAKRSLLAEILHANGDVEGHAEKTIGAIYKHLSLKPGETEQDVLRGVDNVPWKADLRRAAEALMQGGKKDQEHAALIQAWLENRSTFESYKRAFLKQDGDIYATLAYKEAVKVWPEVVPIMAREAQRVLEIDGKLKSVRLASLNAALFTVAGAMIGHYERHKRLTDTLDFDDLIIRVSDLLSKEGMAPWVLYKLDEGIDHILVDEAQDTSRHQWRVVSALCGEFFDGVQDRTRTLFVVGDEKQSIFSFQGADPASFERMKNFFGGKVQALQEGWEVSLDHSFRSTRAVLEVVDHAFTDVAAKRGVVQDITRDVRHLAYRKGQAGLVEVWPLIEKPVREKGDVWALPVELDAGESVAQKLSDKIAGTIKKWIETKEILPSKGRPIQAGDIMILVQSRGALVEPLIRALKKADVNVAGADRMKLLDEIAVLDLLALAQASLQPGDDLTLAALLKSPLIGLDEEALYKLCHQRNMSLIDSVRRHNPALHAYLKYWRDKAGKVTPYEFFAEALSTPCFADDRSGRRALYARLSADMEDALDEFLNACLLYEQTHTPALQKFVDWFFRGQTEIKREQEGRGDAVRIMTVHASKGLQAPIVFLPDTAKKMHTHGKSRPRLLWPDDAKGVPLWSPRAELEAPAYTQRKIEAQTRQEEEYRRLLYVALTRAEDRLYVAGTKGKNAPAEDCWYNLVANAFPPHATKGEEGLRLAYAQEAPPETEKRAHEKNAVVTPPPAWLFAEPQQEPQPPQPLAPSKPDEEPGSKSPLVDKEEWRWSRGQIVHKLLELLPLVANRDVACKRYLAQKRFELSDQQQKNLHAEIMAVLNDPDFAPIFSADARAEVPVVGLAGKKILSGQIDRLLVGEKEILIVDYKTNRPPPLRAEDVSAAYLKQMAAYRAVIRNIYPGKPVKCALLWTDGPRLMPLSDKLLDPQAP